MFNLFFELDKNQCLIKIPGGFFRKDPLYLREKCGRTMAGTISHEAGY